MIPVRHVHQKFPQSGGGCLSQQSLRVSCSWHSLSKERNCRLLLKFSLGYRLLTGSMPTRMQACEVHYKSTKHAAVMKSVSTQELGSNCSRRHWCTFPGDGQCKSQAQTRQSLFSFGTVRRAGCLQLTGKFKKIKFLWVKKIPSATKSNKNIDADSECQWFC